MEMCDRKNMFCDKSTFGLSSKGKNMPKKDHIGMDCPIIVKSRAFQAFNKKFRFLMFSQTLHDH